MGRVVTEGPAPQRVRVTGPPRRRAPRQPRTGDIDEQTQLGEVYLGSLLRVQLTLAVRIIGLLVLGVGSMPLLFHLAPGLAGLHLLGLPISWLFLGVAVYPLLLALGWRYVVRAERNERDFAELLSELER